MDNPPLYPVFFISELSAAHPGDENDLVMLTPLLESDEHRAFYEKIPEDLRHETEVGDNVCFWVKQASTATGSVAQPAKKRKKSSPAFYADSKKYTIHEWGSDFSLDVSIESKTISAPLAKMLNAGPWSLYYNTMMIIPVCKECDRDGSNLECNGDMQTFAKDARLNGRCFSPSEASTIREKYNKNDEWSSVLFPFCCPKQNKKLLADLKKQYDLHQKTPDELSAMEALTRSSVAPCQHGKNDCSYVVKLGLMLFF